MSIIDDARKLRSAMTKSAPSLDDATASTAPDMFPRLKLNGELVKAGTRINWKGVVKRAAVDLWDTAENSPDNATALWEDISYRDGYRIIPEVISVTTSFQKGEYGWWGDILYVSLANENVYTPKQYPEWWEEVK